MSKGFALGNTIGRRITRMDPASQRQNNQRKPNQQQWSFERWDPRFLQPDDKMIKDSIGCITPSALPVKVMCAEKVVKTPAGKTRQKKKDKA